jgi:hypothetical protein
MAANLLRNCCIGSLRPAGRGLNAIYSGAGFRPGMPTFAAVRAMSAGGGKPSRVRLRLHLSTVHGAHHRLGEMQEEVERRVLGIITTFCTETQKVDAAKVVPTAHFMKDLGLDRWVLCLRHE